MGKPDDHVTLCVLWQKINMWIHVADSNSTIFRKQLFLPFQKNIAWSLLMFQCFFLKNHRASMATWASGSQMFVGHIQSHKAPNEKSWRWLEMISITPQWTPWLCSLRHPSSSQRSVWLMEAWKRGTNTSKKKTFGSCWNIAVDCKSSVTFSASVLRQTCTPLGWMANLQSTQRPGAKFLQRSKKIGAMWPGWGVQMCYSIFVVSWHEFDLQLTRSGQV